MRRVLTPIHFNEHTVQVILILLIINNIRLDQQQQKQQHTTTEMAPSLKKRHLRWPTKTKRGFAGTVPDWTIAEDDDDKYDVHIMRRRSVRHRLRRDITKASAGNSEVEVSILQEDPYAKQPDSKVPKEEEKEKSGSESDSESDDESGSDDENEESDDEEESDPVPSEQDKSLDDKDIPYKVKLPATATDTPNVEAPPAEGSTEGSMVSSTSTTRPSCFGVVLD